MKIPKREEEFFKSGTMEIKGFLHFHHLALLGKRHQQDADYKPDSVAKNHLSGTGVAAGLQQLTQGIGRESLERPLFSFAPDGVCLSPGRRRP